MKKNYISVLIEPVHAEDYERWIPLWLKYQEFYKVYINEETTLFTWGRFLNNNDKVYCAVARSSEEIVGFVTYLYHPSTWAINDFCYLEDLYVTPEARGLHVGKKLIEFVQAQARKQECARLYWHTQETNLPGQKLYDWIAEKPGVIEYRMPL